MSCSFYPTYLTRIDQPLWASSEALALRGVLANAYGPRPEASLVRLISQVGLMAVDVAWDRPATDIWRQVMELARDAGRLLDLIAIVLNDDDKSGFHEAIRKLIAVTKPDPSIASFPKQGAQALAGSAHLPEPYVVLQALMLDNGPEAALPEGLVSRVLELAPVVQDMTAYLLARVAWWRKPQRDGDLDRRFTRMTLVMDQGENAEGLRWQAGTERFTDLREVQQALEGRHPVLVLLGEPGAGKTTLLRRLELALALESLTPSRMDDRLVFYQSLSDYHERELSPREWLVRSWANAWPRMDGLEAMLASGRPGLLLLDALNEMPHSGPADYEARLLAWRHDLRRWTRERPGLRVIFSCRSLDYSAPLSGDDLPVPQVQINRLDDEQIRDFLAHYLSQQQADVVWRQLAYDPRQVDLFRTPYYLRLLTLQVAEDGAIPPGRAALFTGFVRQVLKREIGRAQPLLTTDGLLTAADRRRAVSTLPWPTPHALPEGGQLVGGLAKLAYGMQERGAAGSDSQITVSWQEAHHLLGLASDDLLEAGATLGILEPDELRESVKFSHQLLQEYFAARQLAKSPDADLVRSPWMADEMPEQLADTIARLPDSEPLPPLPATGWEETSLLAAEMLPAGAAAAYVRELVAANLPLAGRTAASAALDLPEALRVEIRQALVGRVSNPGGDLRARIAAGLALGKIGDPRFAQRQGPHGRYLMPPLIAISAGKYPMGSDAPDAWDDERPAHMVNLQSFRIGQFPVTNAEYACFMGAGGYLDERWWETENARAWLRGDPSSVAESRRFQFDYLSVVPTDDRAFDLWCADRPNITTERRQWFDSIRRLDRERLREMIAGWFPPEAHTRPEFWTDPGFDNPTQPVKGVSWYEAQAYCAWLAAQIDQAVALASEPEWEAAARGVEGLTYPFGNAFDSVKANTFESHVRHTTPVGVYADGQSPDGVMDLCGNVWEWTRSLWSKEGSKLNYGYPYQERDGREDSNAPVSAARVVRGGAWFYDHRIGRASCRNGLHPFSRTNYLGFRCVISHPILPESPTSGAEERQ